jgi:predicted glycosyltransferase
VPDPNFRRTCSLPADAALVVVRPPGYWADYYRGRGELFAACLEQILADPAAFIVFLPRIPQQAEAVRHVPDSRLLVPTHALDGPNLVFHADLVASAGGTMNREAAVLGTPAYTVFEGALGAVDEFLVAQGRLKVVRSRRDLRALTVKRKAALSSPPPRRGGLVNFVTDAILTAA